MDGIRPNALLLKGTPISHLPTARIFAYATHFAVKPVGLEWIDDTTCVLVFSNKNQSQMAHRVLQKLATEEPDDEGYVTAKPVPITLWPPEERINSTLGMGEGLKGTLLMRWARRDDVKQKGAKKQSQFYKKHGETAGKVVFNADLPLLINQVPKRRRLDYTDEGGIEEQRRLLDAELDAFLAEDDETPVEDQETEVADFGSKRKRPRTDNSLQNRLSHPAFALEDMHAPNRLLDRIDISTSPPSKMRADYIDVLDSVSLSPKMRSDHFDDVDDDITPPSKMRSDYIDSDGRLLLERKPKILAQSLHDPSTELYTVSDRDRPKRRLPRRRAGPEPRRSKQESRVHKTQQELDDELDAFLNDRDV